MAERRRNLNQLLAQGLSGKEIARLALQTHMEEQAGEKPTFSEADLERTRTTLRGRPGEAAIYNAWIEAARIIDFTSMEAITKSLEAEKRLIWVTNSIIGMLRQGWVRYAKRQATKILTLAEWATFPARREQARQARMAEEKIDFAEVTRNRAWWLASEELKARARALPDFDESGSGERYDYLLDLDAAAALALHETATTELAQLIKARKLRFVRNGKNVSAKLKAGKRASLAGEGVELAEEAECTLLELLEAGLPEWVEQGRAEYLTPSEFQGPVAVLQEVQPECLDEHGQFVEPGWKRIDEGLQRELRPERLKDIQQTIDILQLLIRAFLARRAIIEVFSQEIGLDLFWRPVREREEAIRDMLAVYNQLAERSWEAEPDEDGFVPPDDMLDLPKDLRLPLIDTERLKPDAADVELMRQRLATPLGEDWWDAAYELGVCGAMGDTDPDRKERVRQRGRELGSINLAFEEIMMETFGADEGA